MPLLGQETLWLHLLPLRGSLSRYLCFLNEEVVTGERGSLLFVDPLEAPEEVVHLDSSSWDHVLSAVLVDEDGYSTQCHVGICVRVINS